MFRMIIAAAALTFAASASANSTVYVKGDSAHILYGDLNLRADNDRQRLVGRIHHAAKLLCDAPDPDPFMPQRSQADCLRKAMADGSAQMNVIVRR